MESPRETPLPREEDGANAEALFGLWFLILQPLGLCFPPVGRFLLNIHFLAIGAKIPLGSYPKVLFEEPRFSFGALKLNWSLWASLRGV